MKHSFSTWQLMTFVFYVAVGVAGLPLLIDSLDGFSTSTRIPEQTRQSLATFGGMMGAIVYFFTIPATNTGD